MTDTGRQVITTAHPMPCSGELKNNKFIFRIFPLSTAMTVLLQYCFSKQILSVAAYKITTSGSYRYWEKMILMSYMNSECPDQPQYPQTVHPLDS